jgi:membrane-associated protease RseP (regulator of RpoE activity)
LHHNDILRHLIPIQANRVVESGLDFDTDVVAFRILNNVANLLPIYPLDGGLILNALIGSVNRKFALIVGWIGVLTGLGLAAHLQSFLIGIPFLLFALQRYFAGSQTIELERLSFAGGVALALVSIATFVLYVLFIKVTFVNT